MRALRRGLLAHWYATLEGAEAAAIEAATAAWYVNVLDEAVFEHAHGQAYRRVRASDRLGQVVMGLELLRNCETHAPVVFDGLLVESHRYGVPLSTGGHAPRSVFEWAEWEALPPAYRDVTSSATQAQVQKRARAEAQHAYKQAVQARQVIETLFDTMAFFQSLDARLIGPPAPPVRWSFVVVREVPDTDPDLAEPTAWHLARPVGLDANEPFLPDLACRSTERRAAQWRPADRTFTDRAKRARKHPPSAPAREVRHVLPGQRQGRRLQRLRARSSRWAVVVGRTTQPGVAGHSRRYRYFVVHDGVEIKLPSEESPEL